MLTEAAPCALKKDLLSMRTMFMMPEMLKTVPVADIVGKVLAFGIGGEEVAILFRREFEVTVGFAAIKTQVERLRSRAVGDGSEDARIQRLPVHICLPVLIFK